MNQYLRKASAVLGMAPPRSRRAVAALPPSRVAVVTGASSGIGLETARELARRGARVVVIGRTPGRIEAAVASIRASTDSDAIESARADFSSLAQVRDLADELLSRLSRIDILINNAGVWHPRRTLSADGIEDTFAVNHLAPFLLTTLLLPRLQASAPARIVMVSSRLHHKVSHYDLGDVGWERRRYRGLGAYAETKLGNVLFANELSRRLRGSGVTSNSVHPGDVFTDVTRDSQLLSLGSRLVRPFLLTPAEGAETSVHVATAPEVGQVSGAYFSDCAQSRPSPLARSESMAGRLWELSERMVTVG